jgi:hypothetical protein
MRSLALARALPLLLLSLLCAQAGAADPGGSGAERSWLARSKAWLQRVLPQRLTHTKAELLNEKLGQVAGKAFRAPTFEQRNAPHAKAVSIESSTLALWRHTRMLPFAQRAAILSEHVLRVAAETMSAGGFQARNQSHARTVGEESALAAIERIGRGAAAQAPGVRRVFRAACLTAGSRFAPLFNADGTVVAAQDETAVAARKARYKSAYNDAGPIAYAWLPRLLLSANEPRGRGTAERMTHYRERARDVVERTSLEDIAQVMSQDLGLRIKLTAEQMTGYLKQLGLESDWAWKDFTAFPQTGPQGKNLDAAGLRDLRWGIRLANATWKAGQVHRAVWEKEVDGVGRDGEDANKTPRIDVSRLGGNYGVFDLRMLSVHKSAAYKAYEAFDLSRPALYRQTYHNVLAQLKGSLSRREAKRMAREAGLARVVYEVFKDVGELKRAAANQG